MKPGKDLIKSAIKSTNSTDLTSKLGGVALDSLLTNGVLRDIPVVGTAMTLYKAGNGIAAYSSSKKSRYS